MRLMRIIARSLPEWYLLRKSAQPWWATRAPSWVSRHIPLKKNVTRRPRLRRNRRQRGNHDGD